MHRVLFPTALAALLACAGPALPFHLEHCRRVVVPVAPMYVQPQAFVQPAPLVFVQPQVFVQPALVSLAVMPHLVAPQAFVAPQAALAPQAPLKGAQPCDGEQLKKLTENMATASDLLRTQADLLGKHDARLKTVEGQLQDARKALDLLKNASVDPKTGYLKVSQ